MLKVTAIFKKFFFLS
uniref:Uncharacterized protein n=1 Tax=Anguilla anguilla TaxID=7936 RepID=A0A0E9V0D4_ANGAN